MKITNYLIILLIAFVSAGCYHATVSTGNTPGTIVIDKPFASGWIYGLVPPSTVEAASECPNGVATVETQLSFVNQLVNFVTGGIYTPMHITVTCAASSSASADSPVSEISISSNADTDEIVQSFSAASDIAAESGGNVHVRFNR